MKYSVEYIDGKFVETLEINNHIATKTWIRKEDEFVDGLCSDDEDFSTQLENFVDESEANDIYNTFDTNTWVADIEDFIEIFTLE